MIWPGIPGNRVIELLLQLGVDAKPVAWAKPCAQLERATVVEEYLHGTISGERAWRLPVKVYDFDDRKRHGRMMP